MNSITAPNSEGYQNGTLIVGTPHTIVSSTILGVLIMLYIGAYIGVPLFGEAFGNLPYSR